MAIQFSLFSGFSLKGILKDFILLFSKKGREEIVNERHDLHFYLTACTIAGVILIAALIPESQIMTMGAMIIVLSWFFAFVINVLREGWKRHTGEKDSNGISIVPFSWRDVRFGGYAGIAVGTIAHLVINYLNS